jgi:hypothetical protein
METVKYNGKGFLLPESINSCASFHAKIMPTGEYMFRIHDCISGVGLRGDLNDESQRLEAIEKLNSLAVAAMNFAAFIRTNYTDGK